MLLAVMRHPAMLLYLDNAGSVGPDSPAGQRGHRGLNENLARECLELHTVSPPAGYTQADVTSFAKILTGWSVDLKADPPGFRFRPGAHEPGEQTVMRHAVPAGRGGRHRRAALPGRPSGHPPLPRHQAGAAFRRRRPAAGRGARDRGGAARHRRRSRGRRRWRWSTLPAAWQPGAKLRTPQEYRDRLRPRAGPAARPGCRNLIGILAGLGQPLWTAPAPNGWPDRAADWAAPEAMLRRIDWASGFAGRAGERDVAEVAEAALGPLLRPDTLGAIRRAGSRRDAMTLLLTSPEFQRR